MALTMFSFGGGQDSTAILIKLCTDPAFRKKYVPTGELIVVMSDTGNEHPHTYLHIKKVAQYCKEHNVPFFFLSPNSGWTQFHTEAWKSLTHQYERNNTIGSAAYRQTCTDNLKVKPLDNFLDYYINNRWYFGTKPGRKAAVKAYTKDHGKIKLILGFAAGEETRTSNGNKFDAVWKQNCVERCYPLIEEGLDRKACIEIIEPVFGKVFPSNCMLCFYQMDAEIVWLHRFFPAQFEKWVKLEKAKLKRDEGHEKNFGVYGKITLEQKLEKALKKFGHYTDEQLDEYKYSHGHCIKSKY